MKNILVLEDDPANLQAFAALLWSKGRDVIEASTSREALDAARRKGRLDLLVSDVALKGDQMSGTEVAVDLLDGYGNLPIVFVTGTPMDQWEQSDRENLRALRLRSRVAILEKPFMPSAFESTVERLLQGNAADLIDVSSVPVAAPNMIGSGITKT